MSYGALPVQSAELNSPDAVCEDTCFPSTLSVQATVPPLVPTVSDHAVRVEQSGTRDGLGPWELSITNLRGSLIAIVKGKIRDIRRSASGHRVDDGVLLVVGVINCLCSASNQGDTAAEQDNDRHQNPEPHPLVDLLRWLGASHGCRQHTGRRRRSGHRGSGLRRIPLAVAC